MKSNASKKLFLEQIKKVPIIQVACEKTGISRATIYRWRSENKKFAQELDNALLEGESLVNDMSESQLISLIREKNFSAIRFWLNHRHEKFRERVEVTAKMERQDELTPEQEQIVREALQLATFTNNQSEEKNYDNKKERCGKSRNATSKHRDTNDERT